MNSIDIFPWNDNFNTGIPLIDEQHKKLADLINLLASHVAFNANIPALNVIFDELAEYAVYHFDSEEKIWHEYMPEDLSLSDHLKVHSSFITEVLRLKSEEDTKPTGKVIEEILAFLTRWLASHILESDRAMAMTVTAIQSGMSLESAKKHASEQMRGSTRVLIDIILTIYESLSTNTLHLMRELAEQKRMQMLLSDQERHFEVLLSTTPVGIFETDINGKCSYVNARWSEITGLSLEEARGDGWTKALHSDDKDRIYTEWSASTAENRPFRLEYRFLNPNGKTIWVLGQSANYKSHLTGQSGYVGTITDITDSKAAESEIKYLAFYDPLTHLPNRRLLIDRLSQALAASTRSGERGAVLFMDLDHFKTLNDTLGHNVGDILLQQVADRLTACVRETDTVSRIGGDEFVILLEDLSNQDFAAATQAEATGHKILTALNVPFALNEHAYNISSSIGITLFGQQHTEPAELLRQADIAMYQAKEEGRNTLRFFEVKMQEAINSRAELENALRVAIAQKQFELYYQIQIDQTGRALGAEALIRWHHPTLGIVLPNEFIPAAEEIGLILPIGQWALETACAQLQAWQKNALTNKLSISLNVSAKQFNQLDFVEQVKATVVHYAINPELLNLEITESLLLNDIEDTINTMNALQAIGIHFELDDFGTGYSSLQYLKKLPLYQLKIDQSFVSDITTNNSDQAIVRTIIAMAKSLMLEVIAEGVETKEQQQRLLHEGCARYQGYFFGKPLPIAEFETLLRKS